MTAALQQPTLQVVMLPVGSIRPNPSNPRKNFRDVEELAANIKASGGIKIPLRVRPIEGDKLQRGYELVFGERRWRAAQIAELPDVPAIVEAMSDQQARELMLIELAQTSGVHPVEEAQVYRELHEIDKLSVEEIAAKVGKSKSHVYGRMKLGDLAEPVRKAALAGDLPATHALLIARVPVKLQADALKAVLEQDGVAIPYRDAVELVHGRFMLQLAGAPFDTTDEKLFPAAGSCAKCPKRTGNQAELFPDVKSPDTCTDPPCFSKKVAAAAETKLKVEEQKGREVLRGGKAAGLFRENFDGRKVLGHDTGFVPLQAGTQYVPDRGYIDVAAAVKKDPKIKVVSVAHPDTGEVVELVPLKALPKEKARDFSNDRYNAAQKTREANEKKRQDFAASLVAPLVARTEKGLGKPELVALVLALVEERAWSGFGEAIERRAGKELSYAAAEKAKVEFEKSVAKKGEAELRGWLCELVLTNKFSAEGAWKGEPEGNLAVAAASLGVDVAQAKKDFEAALKGRKAAPASCSIPGCGEAASRGGFCANHDKSLSAAEKKSILERNKRLAAEGKLPKTVPPVVKKAAPKKKGKKK